MAILRPFTAHYARFSKSGPGGYDLWMRDGTWRAYSYLATGLWVFAFGSMALLSLVRARMWYLVILRMVGCLPARIGSKDLYCTLYCYLMSDERPHPLALPVHPCNQVPVMTGMFSDYDALNIVFDYIVPGIILLAALAGQGVLGRLYRSGL